LQKRQNGTSQKHPPAGPLQTYSAPRHVTQQKILSWTDTGRLHRDWQPAGLALRKPDFRRSTTRERSCALNAAPGVCAWLLAVSLHATITNNKDAKDKIFNLAHSSRLGHRRAGGNKKPLRTAVDCRPPRALELGRDTRTS
jgi:hypothetical protein